MFLTAIPNQSCMCSATQLLASLLQGLQELTGYSHALTPDALSPACQAACKASALWMAQALKRLLASSAGDVAQVTKPHVQVLQEALESWGAQHVL